VGCALITPKRLEWINNTLFQLHTPNTVRFESDWFWLPDHWTSCHRLVFIDGRRQR
jgi:hypothetical protein